MAPAPCEILQVAFEQKMDQPRQARVKNKAPAPVQITAEQLLREASERLDPNDPTKKVKQFIDDENIDDYRQRNRQFFEDKLHRDRNQMGVWIRYAAFEEFQKEWQRARSIYERALDVDPYNITVFLKYAEMEMKNKHVNLARNIWDRAVAIQPRVDQFWYKYAYMEEVLGNTEAARAVYERWMMWQPEEAIWFSFIKFERRYKQWDRVRKLYESLVALHNTVDAWLHYAKFAEDGRHFREVRSIFERAVETIGETRREPKLFIEFARFEVKMKEYERARVVYRFALDLYPKSEAEGLWNSYAQFERQYGDDSTVTDVVMVKRRTMYIEKIAENPLNYDAWFDYIRLEEENGDVEVVRDVYERAIANIPPAAEKRLWRRYVYLWIYYAVYEELDAKDNDRTLAIYKAALDIIPHRQFTFAKVWTMLVNFYIRHGDLHAARKTMGTALGMCPKPKLFKNYIELEMRLREFDRCRIIYEKFIEFDPANSATWIQYAELEHLLLDEDRVRAIYELAINQEADAPEAIWKSYIDWETEEERYGNARALYERLLDKTEHIKVWVSYANFEASLPTDSAIDMARAVLERAYQSLAQQALVPERILLQEAWREMELSWSGNDPESPEVKKVEEGMAKKVAKIRINSDGEEEEYVEYIFPEDEPKSMASKLLAKAHEWKKTQTE